MFTRFQGVVKWSVKWGKRIGLVLFGAAILATAWYVVDREAAKKDLSETKTDLATCQSSLKEAQAEPERLKASALEQGLVLR